MSRLGRWLFAAFLVASPIHDALGQPPPNAFGAMPGAPGGQNPIMMLQSPALQKELKLDEAQKARAFEIHQAAAARARDINQSLMSPATTQMQFFEAINRLRQENDKALTKLLDAKQKERFEQIVLRIEGPLAVGRPEIASKLGLTQTQRQKVMGVMNEFQMTQRRLIFASRQRGMLDDANRSASKAQAAQLRAAATQQLSKVLNRKQKDAFNALLGEPFDLSKIDPELPSSPMAASSTADAEPTAKDGEMTKPASKKSER